MRTVLVFPLLSLCIGFGQSTQDRAHGFLDDSLRDKNPDTRKHAVQALGLVSAREPYLSQLEGMLEDKDVEVRLATITSLVDLKSARTVLALQKALDSQRADWTGGAGLRSQRRHEDEVRIHHQAEAGRAQNAPYT
jgi:HEAT repeat protein